MNDTIYMAVFCLYDCLFCGDSTILYKFKNCYFYFKVVGGFLKPGLATWYNRGIQVLMVEFTRNIDSWGFSIR